jgi:hypothetical protein
MDTLKPQVSSDAGVSIVEILITMRANDRHLEHKTKLTPTFFEMKKTKQWDHK